MGMFTHLGIGWELCWLIVIALYTVQLVRHGREGHHFKPTKRQMYAVCAICWSFPIIWWTIFGLAVNAYDNSSGYFCWVKFTPAWISIVFADAPLLICCIVVTSCYGYVAYSLFAHQNSTEMMKTGGNSFTREIRKSLIYIGVYILWVHPYLAITIVTMSGGISYNALHF